MRIHKGAFGLIFLDGLVILFHLLQFYKLFATMVKGKKINEIKTFVMALCLLQFMEDEK